MEIKTKFNLGDVIWYIDSHARLCHSIVAEIEIRVISNTPIIHNLTECNDIVQDKFGFGSKKELIDFFTKDV